MDRHLSDEELEGYRARTLPSTGLISTSDHLESCDDCYKRFNKQDRIAATYAFVRDYINAAGERGPGHLLYEQMAGYVDDLLETPESEAVREHIGDCRECDSDVRDLEQIKGSRGARVIPDGTRSGRPVAAAAESGAVGGRARGAAAGVAAGSGAAAEGNGSGSIPGIRRRDRSGAMALPYWQQPVYRVAIQAACLVVVVGIAVWGLTRGLRSEVRRLEQEAAALQQSNDELRQKAADADRLQSQLAELERDNDRLRGDSGVSVNDAGGVVALGKAGEVTGLEGVPSQYRDLVKSALASGQVSVALVPAAKEGRVGTTLGGGEHEKFNVVAPVRSAVESDRPVLKWQALQSATGYVVFIKDTATGEEMESEQIAKTNWTPTKPLARGHVYNWMVEAEKDGRRVRAPSLDKPYASFKVVDDRQAAELREAKQKWAGSHLLLGVLYAKAGVKDEAAKEFEALQAENPGSPLAKKLLGGVR
jgi:hypothetical protein